MKETLERIGDVVGPIGVGCLLAAAGAGFLTLVGTPLVRMFALRWNIVDQPGPRRVHTRPTARLGGPAILLGILGGTLLGHCVSPADATTHSLTLVVLWPVLAVGTLVCAFGAIDDCRTMSPKAKLVGLGVAGGLLALSGVRIESVCLPGGPPIEFGVFAIPATIAWVLACTNAVNVIDGVDGAGASLVMSAAFTMTLLAMAVGDPAVSLLFGATSGAAAGFLCHNKQPASIFLGDSGSLLLGFMLAAASIAGRTELGTESSAALMPVGALLVLAVPFLDATQSFVRRFRAAMHRGTILTAVKATAVADLSHIHHRLLRRGHSHRRVAAVFCAVTTLTGTTILLLVPHGSVHWTASLIPLTAGAFLLYRLASVTPIVAKRISPARRSDNSDEDTVDIPRAAPPPELPVPTVDSIPAPGDHAQV